jgi:hypothetical protein
MHRMLLACLIGCGSLHAAAEDESLVEPAPAAVSPPPDEAGAAACTEVTTELPAVADTVLFQDACDISNTYGGTDGLNAFAGAAAFRFALDLPDAKAFARRGVTKLSIVLGTNTQCSDCGAAGLATRGGAISAHAMRSDWDEGTTGRTGADGCRRLASPLVGWGKDAAAPSASTRLGAKTDYDETPAGFVTYADAQTHLEIELSPDAVIDFRNAKGDGTSSLVSIYVTSTAQIVLAARESGKPARLRVTRCE